MNRYPVSVTLFTNPSFWHFFIFPRPKKISSYSPESPFGIRIKDNPQKERKVHTENQYLHIITPNQENSAHTEKENTTQYEVCHDATYETVYRGIRHSQSISPIVIANPHSDDAKGRKSSYRQKYTFKQDSQTKKGNSSK